MITESHSGTYYTVMQIVVRGFETGGVSILAVGSVLAVVGAAARRRRIGGRAAYDLARRNVGQAILLGLEFLVIADIVLTITVDLSLASAGSLGLIVLVRTFLSFSLEVELDGQLPWRRPPPSPPHDDGSSGHESPG